ncbi:MAG: glycerate kinase [Conexibacter sp.]
MRGRHSSEQLRVLVAPDSFKGTFAAPNVADAIARGLERAGLAADRCPVADGGEGTLEAIVAASGGRVVAAPAHDPLGRPIEGRFALLRDGRGALVETAAASGLALLAEDERDPWAASTFGTGELILAAIDAGAEVVFVTVGGSATTDGGEGALQAIDEGGGLRGARLVVLCDVRTPFERAAEVYGPQKGADPVAVRRLTERLHALAGQWPRDPRTRPMTGGAGGLSGGLWAALGAELVPGAGFVLDALRFDARLKEAGAVFTGEGKLDEQSLEGKAVGEVATRARQRGVPCHAIVGEAELDRFGRRLLDLDNVVEATTLEEVERAAEALSDRLPRLERRR